MLRSMTGFGRCKMTVGEYEVNIDVRSVNHRYFDFSIKIPKYYAFLEDKIREYVSKYIQRGKVEISIYIKPVNSDEKEIVLNEPLCDNYINVLSSLRDKLGTEERIDVRLVSRFNDIFEMQRDALQLIVFQAQL